MRKTIWMLFSCALSFALIAPCSWSGPGQGPNMKPQRPFRVEDALALEVLHFDGSTAISSDHAWMAYTVTDGYRGRSGNYLDSVQWAAGTHLWVRSLAGDIAFELTSNELYGWLPVWSSDGTHLAFYTWKDNKVSIGVWNMSDHQTNFFNVNHLSGRIPMQWHPDGRHIVCTTNRTDWKEDHRPFASDGPITVLSTRDEPPLFDKNRIDLRRMGLVSLDVQTGEVRTIAPPDYPNLVFSVSPNGKKIAVLGSVKNIIWVSYILPVNNLTVFSWDEAKSVTAIRDTTTRSFSWSPDGEAIAYTDSGGLWVVTLDGRDPVRIGDSRFKFSGVPVWAAHGSFLICQGGGDLYRVNPGAGEPLDLTSGLAGEKSQPVLAPDGETLWFRTNEPELGQQGLAKVSLSSGTITQLVREDAQIGEIALGSNREVLFARQTESEPENVWLINSSSGARRQLTDTNSRTRTMSFGSEQMIHWKSLDGEALKGVLLLPPGYQQQNKYPVIVWVYETFSDTIHHFPLHLYNLQVLTNQGYVVLMPDVIFEQGHTSRSYVHCVLPALDMLEERGIANGRFGLMGHSFGGFATNILTTQTARFKASIAIAGISDWVSFSGGPEDFMRLANEHGQGRLGGPLWEVPERYIENSPVFHLNQVATPILIIHGLDDFGVPFQQAEEMYFGLRRLGKTATLVAYSGEDHLYWNTRRTVLVDMWQRILDWFDQYLKSN